MSNYNLLTSNGSLLVSNKISVTIKLENTSIGFEKSTNKCLQQNMFILNSFM